MTGEHIFRFKMHDGHVPTLAEAVQTLQHAQLPDDLELMMAVVLNSVATLQSAVRQLCEHVGQEVVDLDL